MVTNDDGIRAPGIRILTDVAKRFGLVKVVAPDRERSACGHSMTMRDPLRVTEFEWDGCEAFEVSGVPTDCVNVGLSFGWPDGCDLILSGVNNGPNLGFDVTYSGTVAAAMEGTILGVPSIAVSMASLVTGAPIHYDTGLAWLEENLERLIQAPTKPLTFLNVNIPNVSDPIEIRGIRATPMGQRVYVNRIERRDDPWGRPYFWQGGVTVMTADQPGTDVQAITEGFVSVTPVSLDWTDYGHLGSLERAIIPRHEV
ncbi:5'/3'-nucleotidase SurE [Fimbriimonas ginsengisoli Gsoil 348]|uniref:5'-nucleotidase SurE n=1 Tax=Fimbriimonas ginsengisoli Gsoil 348 TaxID=661478 RepID=A0A068NJZ8_FIMGI|nr:5'/3'-nucleotidase SurE [Fimbriimonas ginsengisoli Gsoil 348]